MALNGLNHITLLVKDLKRSEAFYADLLGLERVGRRGDFMHFYSSGRQIHELALVQDPHFNSPGPGVAHIAWNLDSEQALAELFHQLQQAGVPTSGGVNHVISHSFYARDPDGYTLEFTCDRPITEWRDMRNAFEQDFPLELAQE